MALAFIFLLWGADIVAGIVTYRRTRRRCDVIIADETTDRRDRVHEIRTLGSWGASLVVASLFVNIAAMIAYGNAHHSQSHHHHTTAPEVLGGVLIFVIVIIVFMAPGLGIMMGAQRALRTIRHTEWREPYRARGALFAAVLVGGFVALSSALRGVVPHHGTGHAVGVWLSFGVALFVVNALGAPLLARALGGRSLEAARKAHLCALAERFDTRIRDVLVVPGRGRRRANAMQIGILATFRYVLITDYLLDHLDEAEVDAVVAHEIAHARRHHLIVKLGVLVVTIGVMSGVTAAITAALQGPVAAVSRAVLAVSIPLAVIVTQGVVGIRLEEQADDDAAHVVGGDHVADALERLGDLNDMKRRTGLVWNVVTQHPGLAERIERLRHATG